MMFRDRRDAGIQLAQRLKQYKDQDNVLVLSLPRGGAVTGFEIAGCLHAPFDVLIVLKLGFPGQPELAIGAIAETGTMILNRDLIALSEIRDEYIASEISRQKEEITRRIGRYRNGRAITGLSGKTVILADDGIATGATMKAAVAALRGEGIEKLVVAVPVSPSENVDEFKGLSDEFICIDTPLYFLSVGSYYDEFPQVTDEEVLDILRQSPVGCRAQS